MAKAVALPPFDRRIDADGIAYRHVRVAFDRPRRRAEITIYGPAQVPTGLAEVHAEAAAFWPLAMARELDDAILHLRCNEPGLGIIVFRSEGDRDAVIAADTLLEQQASDWFVREARLLLRRVFKRVDVTSRSLFTLIEPGSCFAGFLAELVFAADRSLMFAGSRARDNRAAPMLSLGAANFAAYPMGNGLSRLATRFLGEPGSLDRAEAALGEPLLAEAAAALGLVTASYDDVDWDEEVRLMLEERASFSPDALTGLEANLRFAGPETMETKIFGRLSAWQNWIFQRPGAAGEEGALKRYGTGQRPHFDPEAGLGRGNRRTQMPDATAVDYDGLIPNNVGLSADPRLRRALESWHPRYARLVDGRAAPRGSSRPTSICAPQSASSPRAGPSSAMCGCPTIAGASSWRRRSQGRTIGFGAHKGEPAWQEVPGEYRAMLRRLVVVQGDTEPASVEQQRHLGATAPSLYDLRNLFQVNVEEARHLWAMVYLLQKYFGRDGREEAEDLLRRSLGRPRQPAPAGRLQRGDARLAGVFHVHLLHRPRRQDAAACAGAIGLRSAVAHLPLHADRGSAPHVRRPVRGRPHHRAHLRGDARRRHRRPARHRAGAGARRHRPADLAEARQSAFLADPRPVRQRNQSPMPQTPSTPASRAAISKTRSTTTTCSPARPTRCCA